VIAALYVDPFGPYFGRADVDPWDAARDARNYAGPHPVVAHPPCGGYSAFLRRLYRRRDHDCGAIAVAQVRRFGGVLEQPAHSRLWSRCGLPTVGYRGDRYGFAECVEQVSWGHVARKRTWLYFVGIDRVLVRATLRQGGRPTHWVSGRSGARHGRARYASEHMPAGIKACSPTQARRTPEAFADWLIALAHTASTARRT